MRIRSADSYCKTEIFERCLSLAVGAVLANFSCRIIGLRIAVVETAKSLWPERQTGRGKKQKIICLFC